VDRQELERLLLGGPRRYTRREVAEKAGVSLERVTRLWRALGFATVPDDEVVFTDADIEAVRTAEGLVSSGLLDPRLEVPVTRAFGQHLSRLAEWQVHMLWSLLAENGESTDDQQVARLVGRLLPDLERAQTFVWRRHLAAFAGRAPDMPEENLQRRREVAGFVDMVGYTRMTRQLDEAELSEVLERFEAIATEAVAEHHGRIVKMIGDEVLFVADSPGEAAEIALALVAAADGDDRVPAVRAGLAFGHILSRFGDVYGAVVNLASRLTTIARPGTVLVDRELATALGERAGYVLRPGRPVSVRGYSRLRPYTLRRADQER
jgi:adenylate cyclase